MNSTAAVATNAHDEVANDTVGTKLFAVGRSWTQYYTEENYAYYVCDHSGHSQVRNIILLSNALQVINCDLNQWEDPRENGLVSYDDESGSFEAQSEIFVLPKPKSPHRRPSNTHAVTLQLCSSMLGVFT